MKLKKKFCFNVTAFVVITLMLLGCGAAQLLPSSTTTTTVVTRDSLVIRTDTLRIPIPVEKVVDVARTYDTLRLETSMAWSLTYVDTLTNTLKGQLQNKHQVLEAEVTYVDRYVETVRDSLVRVEVPVEVEVPVKYVPRWCRVLLVFDLLLALVFAAWVYWRLRV